jgi:hypothetical protein
MAVKRFLGALVIASALVACSSGSSSPTSADLSWCVDLLDLSKQGHYDDVSLEPTSIDEYVLKTSSGLERVDFFHDSVPYLFDIAEIDWESSTLKSLGRKAESVREAGEKQFMDSRDPNDWRDALADAEKVRDETLLACGG